MDALTSDSDGYLRIKRNVQSVVLGNLSFDQGHPVQYGVFFVLLAFEVISRLYALVQFQNSMLCHEEAGTFGRLVILLLRRRGEPETEESGVGVRFTGRNGNSIRVESETGFANGA